MSSDSWVYTIAQMFSCRFVLHILCNLARTDEKQPTVHCLVNLIDIPFFVLPLADIAIVHLERVKV